jgi:hypothetical protein
MKIQKLSALEYREWRTNAYQLVSSDGSIFRAMTADETKLVDEHERQEKIREAGCRKSGNEYEYAPPAFREGEELYSAATSRTLIKRLYIAAEPVQAVQLRSASGQVLATVQNDKVARPSVKDSNRTVPAPANCPCIAWGKPHPGVHAQICVNNTKAPAHERWGYSPNKPEPTEIPKVKVIAPLQSTPVAQPKPQPAPKVMIKNDKLKLEPGTATSTATARIQTKSGAMVEVPAPEDCECKNWVRPQGCTTEGHHPTCKWLDAWEERHGEAGYLVSMATGEIMRRASKGEILRARASMASTGVPLVEVGGGKYILKTMKKEEDAGLEGVQEEAS